jgi:hypothetical protein
MNITDDSAAMTSDIHAQAGQQVTLRVNVDADAVNIKRAYFTLDCTTKTPGAPVLTGKYKGVQIFAELGALFKGEGLGGIPSMQSVEATVMTLDMITVKVMYGNPFHQANGPGCLVSIPLTVPEDAAAGARWTIKFRIGTVALENLAPIDVGTLGSATLTVDTPLPEGPPPVGGMPGPDGDGKVDMNITNTSQALVGDIKAPAGSEVMLRVNVDRDAYDVGMGQFILQCKPKSLKYPTLTGKRVADPAMALEGKLIAEPGSILLSDPQVEVMSAEAVESSPGTIVVTVSYFSTRKKASGPGSLLLLPVVVPKDAPAGAQWTISIQSKDLVLGGPASLPIGTLSSARLTVADGTPVTPPPDDVPVAVQPPGPGGLPGPSGDGLVDMNVTDTSAALAADLVVSPGDVVPLRVNVDGDVTTVSTVLFFLDCNSRRSVNAPTITAIPEGKQAKISLGDIFPASLDPTTTGATADESSPGIIGISVSSFFSGYDAHGPGGLVVVPVQIPKDAPEGAQWNVFVRQGAGSDKVAFTAHEIGTLTQARMTVGQSGGPEPPPGIPGDEALSITSAQVAPGQAITLDVSASAALKDLAGLDLVLKWPPPAGSPTLTFGSAVPGPLLAEATPICVPGSNSAQVALMSAQGRAGPGVALRVTLNVPQNAKDGAQYTIEAAGTYVDSLGHETVAKVTSGTLTVKATAPPSGAKGDVNGDGKVSVGDVVLALRAVAGLAQLSAQQSVAADVNGDGKLSVGDVVLLLRVVARLITLGA